LASNKTTPTLPPNHTKVERYGQFMRWWQNLDAFSKPRLYIHLTLFLLGVT
jgi:hypothetical protein